LAVGAAPTGSSNQWSAASPGILTVWDWPSTVNLYSPAARPLMQSDILDTHQSCKERWVSTFFFYLIERYAVLSSRSAIRNLLAARDRGLCHKGALRPIQLFLQSIEAAFGLGIFPKCAQ
jgi:hypothetical protein